MPAGALYLRRRVFYKGNRISYLYIYFSARIDRLLGAKGSACKNTRFLDL